MENDDLDQRQIRERFDLVINKLKELGVISTNKEIAEKVGYSPQRLNEILKGRTNLSFNFLKKFCTVYNLNLAYLLLYDEEDGVFESAYNDRFIKGIPDLVEGAIAPIVTKKFKQTQQYIEDKEKTIKYLQAQAQQQEEKIELLKERLSDKDHVLSMKDELLKAREEMIKKNEELIATQKQHIEELSRKNNLDDLPAAENITFEQKGEMTRVEHTKKRWDNTAKPDIKQPPQSK